jgi:hypothetical protein
VNDFWKKWPVTAIASSLTLRRSPEWVIKAILIIDLDGPGYRFNPTIDGVVTFGYKFVKSILVVSNVLLFAGPLHVVLLHPTGTSVNAKPHIDL